MIVKALNEINHYLGRSAELYLFIYNYEFPSGPWLLQRESRPTVLTLSSVK